jgi:hypothetical protein
VVAFPPPPVTLPATRLNVLRPERLASNWLITSKRSVARFYPNNSEIFRSPSKPFGFDFGRTMITDVRYLLSLERCAQIARSPARVHGSGLELKHDKAGVSVATQGVPEHPFHSLPATLRMTGLSPILSYSKGSSTTRLVFQCRLTRCLSTQITASQLRYA